jgi:hypothetical protein
MPAVWKESCQADSAMAVCVGLVVSQDLIRI